MGREYLNSYLAGVLDGNGTICVLYSKKWNNYLLCLSVNASCPLLQQFLVDNFGGFSLSKGQAKCSNSNQFRWGIASSKIAGILKDVSPYIVSKKRHLELAFKFSETINPAIKPTPQNTLNIRKEIYQEMQALNGVDYKKSIAHEYSERRKIK